MSLRHDNNIDHGIRASEFGSPDASYSVGHKLQFEHKYEKAIKYYEIAIEQGNIYAYNTLAIMHWQVEEVRDLAEAAKLFRIGIWHKASDSEENFKQLLSENPNNPDILYHAGMANTAEKKDFNHLAKNQMDIFVALSMDDKWEDICPLLDKDLHETIIKKREALRKITQGTLEDLHVPAPVARIVRGFWSQAGMDVKETSADIAEIKPTPKLLQ